MGEARKIAAILVADIVGYSRLAGTDEECILARLWELRSAQIDPAISSGRLRSRLLGTHWQGAYYRDGAWSRLLDLPRDVYLGGHRGAFVH